MLCEKCQQRDATLHVSKIVNSHKTERYLCEACAAAEGISNYGYYANPFDSMLANFFNDSYGSSGLSAARHHYRQNSRQCPQCGMTEATLLQNGKLGCAECYKVFEDRIDPLLRRIHGNNKHFGKKPSRSSQSSEPKTTVDNAEPAARAEQVRPSQNNAENQKLSELKAKMQQAITDENFEQAAVYRDQIKSLDKEQEKGVQS